MAKAPLKGAANIYSNPIQNLKRFYFLCFFRSNYRSVFSPWFSRRERRGIGHSGDHHLHQHQHQAVDGLVNLFTKANHDLTVVHNNLDKEFQQIYPDNANPMKLVCRIKKVQEELSTLKEQCRELLAAKQAAGADEDPKTTPQKRKMSKARGKFIQEEA